MQIPQILRGNSRGVTLVELLVSLTILSLVIAGVYQIYTNIERQSVTQEQVAEVQQNVRVSIEQITRELRSAGYRYGNPVSGVLASTAGTTLSLTTADNNTLTIQGDYDNNGVPETIVYGVDCPLGGSPCLKPWLMRNYNNSGFERFSANITNVSFNFFDGPKDDDEDGKPNGPTIANTPMTVTPSNVRRVTVTLTGRTDRPDKDYKDPIFNDNYRYRTVAADVVLRNFDADQGDVTPPACPVTLTASPVAGQCGSLNVTWSWSGTDTDLAGFVIYYTTDPITVVPPTASASTIHNGMLTVQGSTARSATLTGLQSNVPYNVIVESYDTFLNTSRCTVPVVSGTAGAGSALPPPGILTAPVEEMSTDQVTLRWSEVNQDVNGNPVGIQGYRVYRGTTQNFVPDATNMIGNETGAGLPLVNLTYFVDNGVLDCNTYYYRVRAVDSCGNVSPSSNEVKATPPDNKKAPGAPTITKAAAGDDDLTIVLSWAPATTNPSPVAGYKIYYGTVSEGPYNGISTVPGMNSPITITDPATTSYEINGLDKTKYYYIKIAAYDAICADETLSSEAPVTSNACSPRLYSPGDHAVFPGQTVLGTPLVNNSTIGLLPAPGNQYVTWVTDPVDCDPDSSNFTRNGFDNTPQPPNANPSVTFKFTPYSSSGTAQATVTADVLYGSGPVGGVVSAPRNPSGYYHFPLWPATTDLDTTLFCNVRHDFSATANDGEGNVSSSSLTLFVNNGGIERDATVPVTSNISTPADFHHLVKFGIKNTNPARDHTMTTATLTWNNLNASLKKLEVLNGSGTVIGSATPPAPVPPGTTVTFDTIPTIPANGGTATVLLTFSGTNLDMRNFSLDSVDFTVKIPLNSTYACTAPLGGIPIPQGPVIDAASTRQDQPFVGATPSQTPTTTPGSFVNPLTSVGISTVASDTTGNASYSVSSVKIYYVANAFTSTTAPVRPSKAGATSVNYPNSSGMTLGGISGSSAPWTGSIGAESNKRIWYYLEAFDTDGNFDIYPESGVFTYAQCGNTLPSLSFISPTPASNANGLTEIRVTTSDMQGAGLALVKFEVTGGIGVPLTDMTLVSAGVYKGTYDAGPVSPKLKHTVTVNATDVCNNTKTITRTLN